MEGIIHKKQPVLIIFAGANGSGKTTLAEQFLPYARIKEFVNADKIANGLSPFNPNGQKVLAGKMLLERMSSLILRGENFAIETTLSGGTLKRMLDTAKAQGYFIKMYYIYTANVNINLKRIKCRVKQEGHGVPSVDVRRRYKRSLENFFTKYLNICDSVVVYDGSGEVSVPVAVKTQGKLLVLKKSYTAWKRMKKIAGKK